MYATGQVRIVAFDLFLDFSRELHTCGEALRELFLHVKKTTRRHGDGRDVVDAMRSVHDSNDYLEVVRHIRQFRGAISPVTLKMWYCGSECGMGSIAIGIHATLVCTRCAAGMYYHPAPMYLRKQEQQQSSRWQSSGIHRKTSPYEKTAINRTREESTPVFMSLRPGTKYMKQRMKGQYCAQSRNA